MIHLTLTGYWAGTVLCDSELQEKVDTCWHAMFCTEAQLARADLCGECLAIWNDAGSDDKETTA
jgi:hypothetical protein